MAVSCHHRQESVQQVDAAAGPATTASLSTPTFSAVIYRKGYDKLGIIVAFK